jgi:hypothetical protein
MIGPQPRRADQQLPTAAVDKVSDECHKQCLVLGQFAAACRVPQALLAQTGLGVCQVTRWQRSLTRV